MSSFSTLYPGPNFSIIKETHTRGDTAVKLEFTRRTNEVDDVEVYGLTYQPQYIIKIRGSAAAIAKAEQIMRNNGAQIDSTGDDTRGNHDIQSMYMTEGVKSLVLADLERQGMVNRTFRQLVDKHVGPASVSPRTP